MSFLQRKFSLGLNNFLSLGLCGKQVEARITCQGKKTLTLSPSELRILHNARSTFLQRDTILSISVNHSDELVQCRCEPGPGHVKFVRETDTQAQALNPEDNVTVEFVLEYASFQAFQRFLPNVITIAEQIMAHETDIALAYDVVQNQLKRLCDANGRGLNYEHFLHIMRLLYQYVPISFLVKDFLKTSPEKPSLNLFELFEVIIMQYDYIYENLYSELY